MRATVASIGAQFLPGPWYDALAKPAWTPPGWQGSTAPASR